MSGEPEGSGVPPLPPDSVAEGDGESEPDFEPDGEGEADADPDSEPEGEGDPDCEPEGEPDCGDGDPDWGEGELDAGGGLPDCPVGGGGDWGGSLRKIRMAISTAKAARSSISSHDTKMVRQPARSKRPGQGSGHRRARPGRTRSIQ